VSPQVGRDVLEVLGLHVEDKSAVVTVLAPHLVEEGDTLIH
jgi:hypothetical protein